MTIFGSHVEYQDDAKSAYEKAKDRLKTYGEQTVVRGKDTLEYIGISIGFEDQVFAVSDVVDEDYVLKELQNILMRRDCTEEHPEHVREHLNPDADSGNIFWGNEVRSALNVETLSRVAEILLKDPMSRRGVLSFGPNEMFSEPNVTHQVDNDEKREEYNVPDYSEDHWEVPCLVNAHFLIRHGKLHLCVKARSSDIYLGMPYDLALFQKIHNIMGNMTNTEVGKFTYSVDVLHAYGNEEGYIGLND